ncbi:3-oxoacyl-ACP synthase [Antrihabitans sp. YC3-6]|uniref:3-oxoacyl-ACP synthase n=1 Tax=Antrihabitans stalagmiti TaxID=2799499 RepID=A0A934NQ44_9NOCA|nr:3-oxoacyl-[acyl-carrier-protein] synthase III C-terminal domain-containing protein [Antrihabitans stalagmiti]MBJ8339250.1 3-oxoacyl-ACP synthase [Antrihabitans stalagmiti]
MTPLATVSLVDVASYLPENRVPTSYFTQYAKTDRMAKNIMFRAPTWRHHVAADETAVDMAERAMAPLIERRGAAEVLGVDILLTHTQLPDLPVLGCGSELAKRMGMKPEWILDVHNGGCASFPYMIQLAQMIMSTTTAKSALIVAVQNAAGQGMTQTEVRKLAQATIPGDGCGVGLLLKSDEAPVLGVLARNYPEFAGDMTGEVEPARKYWEPGEGQWRIAFTEAKIMKVFARGNRLVPEVATALCDELGIKPSTVDTFVTNQPNRLFLRNWGDALELPAERHPDTFDECGNLFGAGIPITLDVENQAGRIKNGSFVLMSAFAHAGDFAAAAAVQWGAEPTL